MQRQSFVFSSSEFRTSDAVSELGHVTVGRITRTGISKLVSMLRSYVRPEISNVIKMNGYCEDKFFPRRGSFSLKIHEQAKI